MQIEWTLNWQLTERTLGQQHVNIFSIDSFSIQTDKLLSQKRAR